MIIDWLNVCPDCACQEKDIYPYVFNYMRLTSMRYHSPRRVFNLYACRSLKIVKIVRQPNTLVRMPFKQIRQRI